jgi:hypothetical protein
VPARLRHARFDLLRASGRLNRQGGRIGRGGASHVRGGGRGRCGRSCSWLCRHGRFRCSGRRCDLRRELSLCLCGDRGRRRRLWLGRRRRRRCFRPGRLRRVRGRAGVSDRRRSGRRCSLRTRPGARGEEAQGIEVAVRITGQPNAEMNVRHGPLRVAGRAERADGIALSDLGISLDRDRGEVDERDRVPVLGANRDAESTLRHRACERDRTGVWREHRLAGMPADVDAPVLAANVGVVTEAERPKNRARCRPTPGAGRRCSDQRGEEHEAECSQSRQHASQRRGQRAPLSNMVTVSSQRAPVEGVAGCAGQAGDEVGGLAPRHPRPDELGDRGNTG